MNGGDLSTSYKTVGDGIVYHEAWDETGDVEKSEIFELGQRERDRLGGSELGGG